MFIVTSHVYVTSKNCQDSYRKLSIRERPEDRFWINLFPSANSLKLLAVVTTAWKFTIAEKSRISASFLRADVRNGVGSKIFNKCALLPFVKYPDRLVIFNWETSAQREEQNNAAPLNLLKSDSSREGIFFGFTFVVDLVGVTKLFFVIVSEASFLHLISHVSTKS